MASEDELDERAGIHDSVVRRPRTRSVIAAIVLAPLLVAATLFVYLRSQAGELERIEVAGLSPVTPPTVPPTAPTSPTAPTPPTTEGAQQTSPATPATTVEDTVPPVAAPVNVLVVGVDERGVDDPETDDALRASSRGDTIVVARIDPVAQRVALLSIPRDLWIEHDGGAGRINSLVNTTDPSALVTAITDVFGIEINHYVAVDFAGFRRLVDLAGGIRIPFDRSVRDAETGFAADPGCQHLDGASALAYARSRHVQQFDEETQRWISDPTSDLGRIARQQDLMRRLYALVIGADYSEVDQIRILTDVIDDLTVDAGLDVDGLRSLFAAAAQVGPERFETYDLNAGLTPTTIGGEDVLTVGTSTSAAVVEQFLGVAPAPPADAPPATESLAAAVAPAGQDC
jgi:LCP family protein required for cell wall assembly